MAENETALDTRKFEFVAGPMCGQFAMTGGQPKIRVAQAIMTDEEGRNYNLGCTYIYERRGDKYYHVTTLHVGAGS